MNIMVTGANGFIAKNLIADLRHNGEHNVLKITRTTRKEELEKACEQAQFIFHLAGVNRPEKENEFMEGNHDFTKELLLALKKYNNTSPILITSSIQAEQNNPYGKSKKAAEDLVFEYGKELGIKTLVYRLPNVFGKWCKPNYNSVVATFCHNITHNLPIQINDSQKKLRLVYIDDIIKEFQNSMDGLENRKNDYCEVEPVHQVELGEIADLLQSFKETRNDRSIPDLSDPFTKKLYSTYLSYLPEDDFGYDLKMNVDERGSFTEFLKTADRGQVSVNVSKPGITKGNHWHHTKNEKFLVVSGKGVIRFRKINEDEIMEYHVNGEELEVIDIPVGYTHNIENLGNTDMVTIMWANELFDPENPDTFYEEV
ncbi:capsular polysaccharide biosynthesis protein CapF [Salinicoccus halitifaciens]|uniref:UDP-2-acetamido-2,6-beta-L-arabino-hexul-4-ose reductase n=1 Tax=Salinicoccus halitifaciens TaxID=1073415 RepID=A0ABV2ECA9_9STAP|nr:capsular polysaccharide biosynthesis protein CapF [Salinicoccus halitifaciens]MCD2138781.1 capsular polysaccharide biosynthesis protein CapF [Salinicoccus halitifaciens]